MTHLEIIKEAYSRCGISFIIRERTGVDGDLWQFLFTVNPTGKRELEHVSLETLIQWRSFLEFKEGQIASY